MAERKSSRIAKDYMTTQEKTTDIKKPRNLEDNYPDKKGMPKKCLEKLKLLVLILFLVKMLTL